MWEKVLNYFYTRFGRRSERKRPRESDEEDTDMSGQGCKQRKHNHFSATEQFLCPNPKWRNSKRPNPCRNASVTSGPSWLAESKENIIDISDNEDVDVIGMWQDTNTLHKCPVVRKSISSRKDSAVTVSSSDDEEVEVVKVVEPLSKEEEKSGNTMSIIQTPSTRLPSLNVALSIKGQGPSRNPLLTQRLKMLQIEDKKPKLALNESFYLMDRMKYSELLQNYTNVPLRATLTTPRFVQKREASSAWFSSPRRSIRNEIVDLTKTDHETVKIDVRKDREHKPSVSSSDEPEVVYSVVKPNSLETKLKLNYYCQEDLISSINEKYKKKKEAWAKEEKEEKMKAESLQKRDKQLQVEGIERLTNYLKITGATMEDHSIEESSKLPQLTAEMERLIDEALIPKPPYEVLVQAYRISIKRHDMQTLGGLNWLNDEIINFYMELLNDRGKLENYPSVYAFNTFFYPRMLEGGQAVLKRWTRKVDIFSFDLLIMPIHLGVHWCMAAVDLISKTIKYYDSMGSPNNMCLQTLLKYLQEECLDKKKVEFDTTGWQLENVQNIPQQMNGSDCGVFSCMYAEFLCRNAKFTFTQKDMPYFRRKMVYEICKQKLLM